MAHATDASTGTGHGRSTCLSVTLLALAADCRVSLPHLPSPSWCRDLAGAALRHLAALLAGVLSPCKMSLALLVVQVYGLYHLLRQLQHSASDVAVTC